jgi:hypothetical protein
VVAVSGRPQTHRRASKRGQVYCRKVTKNFGQSAFLSAREIEHGRFRALFAGGFALRCRMVEFHPKAAFSSQYSAFSEAKAKAFYHRGHRGHGESSRREGRWRRRLQPVIALKPTPIWNDSGMTQHKSFGILVDGYRGRGSARYIGRGLSARGTRLRNLTADERGFARIKPGWAAD